MTDTGGNTNPLAQLRVPPNSLEAERAVLGAIFIDNSALDRVADVQPTDFYRETHRHIFEGIHALARQSEPLDVLTVGDYLRTVGHFENVGGLAYLNTLLDAVPTAANVAHYGRIVREKAVLRRIIGVSTEAAAAAYAEPEDASEFAQHVESAFFAINATARGSGDDAQMGAQALAHAAMDRICALADGSAKDDSIATGWRPLDEFMGGWRPKEFIVIAARPGMGKTSLALCTTAHAAETTGRVALFFSLEMSKEDLMMRLISSRSGVNGWRLSRGLVRHHEWAAVQSAASWASRLPLIIDDTAGITIGEVRARTRRAAAQFGHMPSMVTIDYLQLMEHPDAENENLRVGATTKQCVRFCKEIDAPVIALSQLSRKCEERADKRPQLADLRDSGSIEQDAFKVVFIYRDWVYDKQTQNPHEAEILVRKNRNGPTGDVRLGFDWQCTRFLDDVPAGIGDEPRVDYAMRAANDA